MTPLITLVLLSLLTVIHCTSAAAFPNIHDGNGMVNDNAVYALNNASLDCCGMINEDGQFTCSDKEIKRKVHSVMPNCASLAVPKWSRECAEYAQRKQDGCGAYCGDGICNDNREEGCENCPLDCGYCEGDDLQRICSAAGDPLPEFSNVTMGKYFPAQWHLVNTGQSHLPFSDAHGTAGEDINVLGVWQRGIYGRSVTIAIVDDGVQSVHHGVQCNYHAEASYDYERCAKDQQPYLYDNHGTKCAGVAAGRDNSKCGVGVAFRANIAGIRLLVGGFSDSLAAQALVLNNDVIDIYSNSWGASDNGQTIRRFPATIKAIEEGARNGRNGKGSLYVWAGGNGGYRGDNSNYDVLTSSRFTIAVAATDWNGYHSTYSELGTNILVNAPSNSFETLHSNIVTIDRLSWTGDTNGDCSFDFAGTSSSCPIVAGVLALLLEANAGLTWRDVQHILVESATVRHVEDISWSRNSAGRWHSPKYGFGRVDAGRAVQMASQWSNVCPQESTIQVKMQLPKDLPITSSAIAPLMIEFNVEQKIKVEHVEVQVSLKHARRGQVTLALQSPSGTVSLIAPGRPLDRSSQSLVDFPFLSVQFWGEYSVTGLSNKWYLVVRDLEEGPARGTLEAVELYIYGTTENCSVIAEETTQIYREQHYEDDIPPEPSPSPDPGEDDRGDDSVWDNIHSISDFLELFRDWKVIKTLLVVLSIGFLSGVIVIVILVKVVKAYVISLASNRREKADEIWTELQDDGVGVEEQVHV